MPHPPPTAEAEQATRLALSEMWTLANMVVEAATEILVRLGGIFEVTISNSLFQEKSTL